MSSSESLFFFFVEEIHLCDNVFLPLVQLQNRSPSSYELVPHCVQFRGTPNSPATQHPCSGSPTQAGEPAYTRGRGAGADSDMGRPAQPTGECQAVSKVLLPHQPPSNSL